MFIIDYVENHIATKKIPWVFPEEKLETTLNEMYEKAKQYAARFKFLGVNAGDRVGLLLGNSSEYPVLLLALWYCNATAVPLRPVSGMFFDYEKYLSSVEDNCKFSTIIFPNDIDESIMNAWKKQSCKDALRLCQFTEMENKPLFERTSNSGDEIAVIQYSSGSTGMPKGVIVTQKMIIAQVEAVTDDANKLSIPVTSMGSWLPFNHDMGLVIGILEPMFIGCRNMLASPRFYMFKPPRWFQLSAEHKVNMSFTTNSAMASALDSIDRMAAGSIDLSQLMIFFGAEKVSAKVYARSQEVLSKFNMPKSHLLVGYGMAENTLGATVSKNMSVTIVHAKIEDNGKIVIQDTVDQHSQTFVSVGTPLLKNKVCVCDENDCELQELTLGEIVISSASLMPGYFHNEPATAQALRGGKLRTNDLGFIYKGELFFHSRKDDMIIVNGRNIVPDDIEYAIEDLPFVRRGSSMLFASEDANGMTALYLISEHKETDNVEDYIEHRKKIQETVYLSSGLILNHVVFCQNGSIEKTSSGKKRRKVIRERFLNNELVILNDK